MGILQVYPCKKKKLIIKKPEEFKDNWADNLESNDKKIVKEYFDKFEELQDKVGFINFIVPQSLGAFT